MYLIELPKEYPRICPSIRNTNFIDSFHSFPGTFPLNTHLQLQPCPKTSHWNRKGRGFSPEHPTCTTSSMANGRLATKKVSRKKGNPSPSVWDMKQAILVATTHPTHPLRGISFSRKSRASTAPSSKYRNKRIKGKRLIAS